VIVAEPGLDQQVRPLDAEVLLQEAKRRTHRRRMVRGIGVLLAAALACGLALASGGAEGSAPSLRLSSFVPSGYRVAHTLQIKVPGQAQRDVAVSLVGPPIKGTIEPATPDVSRTPWWWSYSDVLVLAYQQASSRWVKIYDARSQPWYWTSGMSCCHGPAIIAFPFTRSPQLHALTTGGHAYLAFATDAIEGNSGQVMVGLVRLVDEQATPTANYVAGYGHPECIGAGGCDSRVRTAVIGPRGSQQLRVFYGLDNVTATSSSDDSRQFFVDLGLSAGDRSFHVAYDDYPELGIECGFQELCTVTGVIPDTPAASLLRRGDVIIGVDGDSLRQGAGQSSPDGFGYQGLLIRVLLLHPHETVRLSVLRHGREIHVRARLTWCANLNFCLGGAAIVV
jgi:hypothetical protein